MTPRRRKRRTLASGPANAQDRCCNSHSGGHGGGGAARLPRDRVAGGVAPAVLPHHRTYGSASGALSVHQKPCVSVSQAQKAMIAPVRRTHPVVKHLGTVAGPFPGVAELSDHPVRDVKPAQFADSGSTAIRCTPGARNASIHPDLQRRFRLPIQAMIRGVAHVKVIHLCSSERDPPQALTSWASLCCRRYDSPFMLRMADLKVRRSTRAAVSLCTPNSSGLRENSRLMLIIMLPRPVRAEMRLNSSSLAGFPLPMVGRRREIGPADRQDLSPSTLAPFRSPAAISLRCGRRLHSRYPALSATRRARARARMCTPMSTASGAKVICGS